MLLGRVMHAVGAAGAVGGAMMLASKVTECSVDGNVPVHIGKWIDGWSKGRTSFHKNDVNPTLQKYVHTILPASSILVPLCGKTLDLGWLAAQDGVDVVVGTEAVEQAMLELEQEPGSILGFQKIPAGDANRPLRFAAWAGAVMKPGNKSTSVGRVHILEGDHFVLDQVDLPPHRGTSPQMPGSARVSAVWDRASLVAVRPQDRSRYVEVYERVLAPKGKILLSTLSYDQDAVNGPPWSVDETEVRSYFRPPTWHVKKLTSQPAEVGKFKSKGIKVTEEVFLITKANTQ